MTPEQLKSSILQYAIQGKLVEQRPEEGTGEELYQQIQAEKQRLIKEGKIKKEKYLSEIAADEAPFDIPESWKWVRLGDIARINGGFAFKSTNYTTDGVRVIRISDFNEFGFINDKIVRHPYDEIFNQYVLDAKNILLCMTGGTVGKSLFVTHIDEKMIVNQRVATIKVEMLLPEYVYQVILAPITQKVIQHSKNSTNDNISMDAIKGFLIPLPPFAEQKRIVAKIEELLPLVDRYATSYEKLEQFNAKFPEDMKKSILQYAIQGKLVEQRPEEGTGEELYQQIQAEKQRLIKEKKIKKEKPLAEISEDEIPFDIPENWKWVRLSTIGITQTGNTPSKSYPEYIGIDIPFITPGDILNGQICYSNQALSLLGKEVARVCCAGSIMQVCIGGSIGKAAITDREVAFNQQVNVVSPIACVSEYLFTVMQSAYFTTSMKERAGGTATPIINRGLWDSLLIPLPPLAEQKRIVAKIEELLPLCERLRK